MLLIPFPDTGIGYVHVDDVADGILLAFDKGRDGESYVLSGTLGTTRDLVTETVALGGIPVELVDTAGIRRAVDEAESIGIRKSLEAVADADIVLMVVDASEPRAAEDEELLKQVSQRHTILVENKSDLAMREFPTPAFQLPVVRTSAITGHGGESGRRDSNPRHSRWERDALPTELRPHVGNRSFPAMSVKGTTV